MENKDLFPDNKIKIEEDVQNSLLGNYHQFLENLKANTQTTSQDKIEQILLFLERTSRHPDRAIQFYTDPILETFCCVEVPHKKVNENGDIIKDDTIKQYLIGVPFIFVAGQAPNSFLRGEMHHEIGHALYTDWKITEELKNIAEQEGYNPQEILTLFNHIEDPRMERIAGGSIRPHIASDLFEKNKLYIIPRIAENIQNATPIEQFLSLLKLEGLWRINKNRFEGIQKPYHIESLHPDVIEAFEEVKPFLEQITGDSSKPALKLSKEYKKIFIEMIWPVYKKLLDKCLQQDEKTDDQTSKVVNQEGEHQQKKESQEKSLNRGEHSQMINQDPEGLTFDPSDPSKWPPHLQKFIQSMIDSYNKRLEQESEKKREDLERRNANSQIYNQEKHNLLKQRDGFENPQAREQYDKLSREVRTITISLERLFKKIFPKTTDYEEEWGRLGTRFNINRLIKYYKTGLEQPLGKKLHPTEKKFLLQIIVDVSGSMYSENRIDNAVKACIAICEAAEKANVDIEILASDDENVSTDNKYLIKPFDERFYGPTKERIINMLTAFGGNNKDADSIYAALNRLKQATIKAKNEAERVGTLMLFITDSTTQDNKTKIAVDLARKFTPLEGFAITTDTDVARCVKTHFGEKSLLPHTIEELPTVMRQIIERNVLRLAQT